MTRTLTAVLMGGTMIAGAASAQQITFAHGANEGNPRYAAAERFAELAGECEGITVSVAPSATMGDDVEMLTSTAGGVIQMTANSQGAMSQIVPEVGALGLPFLFEDLPQAWEVLDGEVGELIDERAQNAGLKVLGFWDNGIRHITHTGNFVETPADLEGVQIRTPPDEIRTAMFEALGANPASLAWSELPTALQSGAFAAQENPLTNIYTANLHEITPYITLTAHAYEATPVVASLVWWSGLDDTVQSCIQDAVDQSTTFQREMSQEQAEALRATMEEEGAQFSEVEDRQAFVDATSGVYDEVEERMPEIVSILRDATSQ